jgi:hypothetical protein
MNRGCAAALLFCALVAACGGPVAILEASTGITGTAVTISGADDLAATADKQARGGMGRIFGYGLIGTGAFAFASGFHGAGALAGVSGVGVAFVPAVINSTFDNAPAATGAALASMPAEGWWVPLTALLYWPLLFLRMLQDPVFLVAGVLTVGLLYAVRQSRQASALSR